MAIAVHPVCAVVGVEVLATVLVETTTASRHFDEFIEYVRE
jgi:hypothetical protein